MGGRRRRSKSGRILLGMATTRPQKKPSTIATEFGRRLRAVREQRGLTQKQLAERIETQEPQISRYEGGTAMPSAETLVSISEVLQVGIDELLLGRDVKRDPATVSDVRLLECMREVEKLDRRFKETAIAVLDAIVVQGNQEALATRLQKRR